MGHVLNQVRKFSVLDCICKETREANSELSNLSLAIVVYSNVYIYFGLLTTFGMKITRSVTKASNDPSMTFFSPGLCLRTIPL